MIYLTSYNTSIHVAFVFDDISDQIIRGGRGESVVRYAKPVGHVHHAVRDKAVETHQAV